MEVLGVIPIKYILRMEYPLLLPLPPPFCMQCECAPWSPYLTIRVRIEP
jgi:hypothetical protein